MHVNVYETDLHRAVEAFKQLLLIFFLSVHRETLLRTTTKMNIGCDFLLNKNLVSLRKFQETER